ncbi:hypothetical protein HPB51_025205 [Rhipicephalus microplus]|uniref:PiggyBac transposable element-derived protein domain-containing protein n=1 Tax=Rhipicephalus microplus TaxID=6941 RepID=A0A9J6EDK7_RHIMP|nr:hypothetical protein HPB51_025205 [Rhipicephalus microplus]
MASIVPRGLDYILYFDNWFCGVDLQVVLKKVGISSVGTVREARLKECKLPSDKDLKKKGRGSYVEMATTFEGVSLRAVKWFDNRPVTLLSTFASASPEQAVKRFDKKTRTTSGFSNRREREQREAYFVFKFRTLVAGINEDPGKLNCLREVSVTPPALSKPGLADTRLPCQSGLRGLRARVDCDVPGVRAGMSTITDGCARCVICGAAFTLAETPGPTDVGSNGWM